MTSLVSLSLSLSYASKGGLLIKGSPEEAEIVRSPVSNKQSCSAGGRVKYLALRLSRTEPGGFIRPGLKWQTEN